MTDTSEPGGLPGIPPPALDPTPGPVAPLAAEQVVAAPMQSAVRHRRRGGIVLIVALIVVGVAGVLGGGGLLAKELTRQPTSAEQATALANEMASRWQRLPAGTIFPATIRYSTSDYARFTAARVGIAPQTSCAAALAPNAFELVRSFGCAAMLRATYINAAGTQAVTVGIAVFSSGLAAQRAQAALVGPNVGNDLYAVPVAGTIADTFGNAQRGDGDVQFVGSYVLFFTAGYTDGMPGSAAAASDDIHSLGEGVLGALGPILSKHTSPCTMKDIKC